MNMEQRQFPHKRLQPYTSFFKIARPTAYFILLLLSYAFGYLSSPSSTSYSWPPLSSTSSSFLSPQLTNFRATAHCSDPIPPKRVRQTLLHHMFGGTSPYRNFPPPHAANRLLRVSGRIRGWGSNDAVFENLIRKVKPRTIIEVGSFLGASALHMANLTRRFGLETQIICVDTFRGWAGFLSDDQFRDITLINGDVLLLYRFMHNVLSSNETGRILPVPYTSVSALMKLCELGVFGDLIAIDAGHDFFSIWADINLGYQILRPGGLMFGHDYFLEEDNEGVKRAVDLFAQIHGFKVQINGDHWVIDPLG